jgi:hypothetical protein
MQPNTADILWGRVEKTATGCWLYRGNLTPNGYGVLSVGGRSRATHRLAWELTHGPVPPGLYICHRCDQPACCNPAHLFLGTPSDNQADSVAKGRRPSRKGSRHPLAKLTDDAVREIRAGKARGERTIDLARRFGISEPSVCRIAKGYGWSHT